MLFDDKMGPLFLLPIWLKNASDLMKFFPHYLLQSRFYQVTQNFLCLLRWQPWPILALTHRIRPRAKRMVGAGQGFIWVLKSQHIKRPFITAVIGLFMNHGQDSSTAHISK